MKLKEPKKKTRKRRVRLQPRSSLPLHTDENGQWRIYTAHLSASGTCIVDPLEMEAVYSMGFFGKGSLSKSFPTFGRRRIGVPPIARNRQWVRRQKWLEELQALNESNGPDTSEDLHELLDDKSIEENASKEFVQGESLNDDGAQASTSKISSEPEEPALNQTDAKNEDESKNIPNEPSEKKLEVDDELVSHEKKTEVEKNENGGVPKTDENQSCTSRLSCDESAHEKKKDGERNENGGVSKEDENQSCTSRMSCDESARCDENGTDPPSSMNVDEVIIDSTEDEDICEIGGKGFNNENDVYFLDEEDKSEDNFKYQETSESMIEEGADPYHVLVLPDTDSDTENYLTNVKSRVEKGGFPINETLHLTFEETFFLMYGLGCLQLIHYDGSIFSITNAWNHFQLQDNYFIQKYIVYHYFRSKGWVVKPGLKFGGDFLLYKEGPPLYHASYIVIVEVLDADTLLRVDGKSMRKVTWKNLIGLERLSETIAKEILFAQILWPSSIPCNGNQIPVDVLSEFTVRELLWRRWDPKRKREAVYVDDDGGDDDNDEDDDDDDNDDDGDNRNNEDDEDDDHNDEGDDAKNQNGVNTAM